MLECERREVRVVHETSAAPRQREQGADRLAVYVGRGRRPGDGSVEPRLHLRPRSSDRSRARHQARARHDPEKRDDTLPRQAHAARSGEHAVEPRPGSLVLRGPRDVRVDEQVRVDEDQR